MANREHVELPVGRAGSSHRLRSSRILDDGASLGRPCRWIAQFMESLIGDLNLVVGEQAGELRLDYQGFDSEVKPTTLIQSRESGRDLGGCQQSAGGPEASERAEHVEEECRVVPG